MIHDIIIIGAGPAGLTAALYAARFLRSTLVIHDNTSRAAQIPLTRNVPGHADGIAGRDLLDRMTRHAGTCGAKIVEGKVTDARHEGGLFHLAAASGAMWSGRSLIVATGVAQNQPPLEASVHQAAVDAGVRACGSRCYGTAVSMPSCMLLPALVEVPAERRLALYIKGALLVSGGAFAAGGPSTPSVPPQVAGAGLRAGEQHIARAPCDPAPRR